MGRSPCCEKAHTNKGAWTKEEDDRLISYIKTNGEGCWRSLPKPAGLLRCGKSCRLRWINYLRPDLKRGNFTPHEDELIIKLHTHLGNKWSLIAGRLPGRTDNEIKNYWNTHIKRKLVSRGIDPATHRPLNEVGITNNNGSTPPLHQVTSNTTTTTTVVSFSSPKKGNHLVVSKDDKSNGSSSATTERCPDLNLDLRMSPAYDENQEEGTSRSFSCSLGLKTSQDCDCTGGSSVGNNICYDFLGLRNNPTLDLRSLELN